MTPTRLVGAYAALPTTREEQERLYAGLATRAMADGLEIPFREALAEDPVWFAGQLRGRFTGCVLTLIPGTMARVAASPSFGLASPDEDGRLAALEHLRAARRAAEELNQLTGEATIRVLHVHSAPSGAAAPASFARSLQQARSEDASFSTELVLEHCDAVDPHLPGEKRFLPLEAEIPLAREAGIGMAVNWGRSAVEAQDASRPREHVRDLAAAGLLRGLMFSGAGPDANRYGGPWADAHLPLRQDETASLMDEQEVLRCLREAGGGLAYVGAKIQVPSDAGVEERLDVVEHLTRLLR